MSAGEADETQSAYGDGGGGPGAPTPLSVLDVGHGYQRIIPSSCSLRL